MSLSGKRLDAYETYIAASHDSSGPVIAPASAVDDADDHPPPMPMSTQLPLRGRHQPQTRHPPTHLPLPRHLLRRRRQRYGEATIAAPPADRRAPNTYRVAHQTTQPVGEQRIISDSANTTSLHYSNNAIAETTPTSRTPALPPCQPYSLPLLHDLYGDIDALAPHALEVTAVAH